MGITHSCDMGAGLTRMAGIPGSSSSSPGEAAQMTERVNAHTRTRGSSRGRRSRANDGQGGENKRRRANEQLATGELSLPQALPNDTYSS